MIIKGNVVIIEGGQQMTPGYVVCQDEKILEVYSTLPESYQSYVIIE